MATLPPSELILPSASAGDLSVSPPLDLPRSVNGCMDHMSAATQATCGVKTTGSNGPCQTKSYPVFSSAIRGRPAIQPTQLSTQSDPVSTRDIHQQFLRQQRSFSLSPDRGIAHVGSLAQNGLSLDEIARSYSHGSTALNKHAVSSFETVPEQSQVHRLLQQNARLRSAWEAERKYLQATRERAEEVYKEEQAIMEEERVSWDVERSQMMQENATLRQERVEWETERGMLRQEMEALRARVALLESGAPARRGDVPGGGDASHDVGPVAFQSTPLASIQTDFGPGPTIHNSSTPLIRTTMAPIVPRPLSCFDPVSAPGRGSGQEPVVDVQQIHPDLEGIPIKTNAVQRPTFRDDPSPVASRKTSSTASPTESDRTPPAQTESSLDKTLQILSAYEADRLTMHAGHTPSHSRTIAPTTAGSEVPTAASSGACTPIAPAANNPKMKEGEEYRRDSSISVSEPAEPVPSCASKHASEDGGPSLEASGDRALRGPLMVRNIPANDEVFFKELTDKLEEVRRSPEVALPAVLRDSYFPDDATDTSEPTQAPGSTADEEKPDNDKTPQPGEAPDEELDIPLKMKKSSNFGAPFGECR